MHNEIIFIAAEKMEIKVETSFMTPDDIGMAGIANYIGDVLPLPKSVAGVKLNEDNSVVFTREDIERYFRQRFRKMKELSSKINFSTFCSTDLSELKYTLEERFDTYVVLVTDPDSEYHCAETLDAFLRETYKWFDETEQQTFYIAGCVDYHW